MQLSGMEQIQKPLNSIEESAMLQNRLINDLLDISSIILGKISIDLKEIDLIAVIQSSIEAVRLNAEQKSIQIELKTNVTKLMMNLDGVRMHQVFINLLSNAIKFTQEEGLIIIDVCDNEHAIEIDVKDNGQGMSPELLLNIFERFTQGKHSPYQYQTGLGLGLTLVRSFLELQGGSITAVSQGENMGSTFSIKFNKLNLPIC